MDIFKMKVARFGFLNRLFELTGGDEMKWYKEEIIVKDLGFDSALPIQSVPIQKEKQGLLRFQFSQYLKKEGLIEYHAFGPIIGITHYGLKVIEEALSIPDKPTNYFPSVEKITDKVKKMQKNKGEDAMKSTSVSIFISHSELVFKQMILMPRIE